MRALLTKQFKFLQSKSQKLYFNELFNLTEQEKRVCVAKCKVKSYIGKFGGLFFSLVEKKN